MLDHIACKEVPMMAVEAAAKVVLVLDGLEVVNVEVPSTKRKEDKDTQRERREVR